MNDKKTLEAALNYIKVWVGSAADFGIEVTHNEDYWVVTAGIRGDQTVTFKYPDSEYAPVDVAELTRIRLLALKTVK